MEKLLQRQKLHTPTKILTFVSYQKAYTVDIMKLNG